MKNRPTNTENKAEKRNDEEIERQHKAESLNQGGQKKDTFCAHTSVCVCVILFTKAKNS